jgi:hypothetical protein
VGERERRAQKQFILVPLTNREYFSPLALPRDFTIISLDYNCSSTLARNFLMLKFNNNRLLKI